MVGSLMNDFINTKMKKSGDVDWMWKDNGRMSIMLNPLFVVFPVIVGKRVCQPQIPATNRK